MQITVVIPTYNRSSKVVRAINSVLAQTNNADQIIVVDDGSDDDTPKVLEAFTDKVIVIMQQNRGVSAARNAGIRHATTEWIALLDSDDEWLPDKLENARRFLLQHPHYKIFQSEEIWIRNGRRVNPGKKHQKYGGMIFRQCLPLCIISPSAVLFKKETWEEAGGFDESLPVCEDYDLWLRIARKYPIGLDPQPGILKYGGHTDQLSGLHPVMDQYRITAIEKHLADPAFCGELRVAALREIVKKLRIIVNGAKKRNKEHAAFLAKLKQYQAELTNLKYSDR